MIKIKKNLLRADASNMWTARVDVCLRECGSYTVLEMEVMVKGGVHWECLKSVTSERWWCLFWVYFHVVNVGVMLCVVVCVCVSNRESSVLSVTDGQMSQRSFSYQGNRRLFCHLITEAKNMDSYDSHQ